MQNTAPVDNALPVTIICDNVREPGNLGSIMRAAAGVGCEKLIIMKGSKPIKLVILTHILNNL